MYWKEQPERPSPEPPKAELLRYDIAELVTNCSSVEEFRSKLIEKQNEDEAGFVVDQEENEKYYIEELAAALENTEKIHLRNNLPQWLFKMVEERGWCKVA